MSRIRFYESQVNWTRNHSKSQICSNQTTTKYKQTSWWVLFPVLFIMYSAICVRFYMRLLRSGDQITKWTKVNPGKLNLKTNCHFLVRIYVCNTFLCPKWEPFSSWNWSTLKTNNKADVFLSLWMLLVLLLLHSHTKKTTL